MDSYNELEVISLCFTKEGPTILLNHHFEIMVGNKGIVLRMPYIYARMIIAFTAWSQNLEQITK